MILPARHTFYWLATNAGVALLASAWPVLLPVWYVSVGMSLLAAFTDMLRVMTEPAPETERFTPHSLPLGVKRTIRLRLHNPGKRVLHLQVFDHFPLGTQAAGFPFKLSLRPDEFAEPLYELTALERGKLRFPCLQIRLLSPWKLWWRDVKLSVESELRVYPNFAAVAHYALLATDNHLSHMGIMKRRRRGEGQDFHQLREYREGDSLRQVDWKATSRMRKPISREYQDERDQDVIFMLDCGYRMLAKDGALSHFDHTLNAILLVAYAALRQGDAVGLGTFSGHGRWLPAHKGQHSIQSLLNALYDLQPTTQAPDYTQAVTELLVRQKKRALVIFLTNLRDEDMEDLMPALHLLRKRHLVLLASMREQAIDAVLAQPVDNQEETLRRGAVEHYLSIRKQTLNRIHATGIRCMDVPPPDLSVNLINHYLDIKRSGLL